MVLARFILCAILSATTLVTAHFTRPYCNETLSNLVELQAVTDNSPVFPTDYVICVNLPPVDYVNYTANIITASVFIYGNGSSVYCNEPRDTGLLNLTQYTYFPLNFANSSQVSMERVHFFGCRRPIQFDQVVEVQLLSTRFSNFTTAGAVEISNSPLILVDNCTFTNNSNLGIGQRRYSGNSGGLAIGYDDQNRPEHLKNITPGPLIQITNSNFTDNNASTVVKFLYTVSEVIRERVYNQRGGGIAMYFGAANYSAQVTIRRCTLDGNYANDSGGGIYMFLSGDNNAHRVTIIETRFLRNEAKDGGGLEITYATADSVLNPNIILINDSVFDSNIGNFGGGFKSIQLDSHGNLNRVTIGNSSFSNNIAPVGSALYLQSLFTVDEVPPEKRIILEDCTFSDNTANRGVVFVIKNTVGFQGSTMFRRSIGPGLRVVGGLVSLGGDILFDSNQRHPEGFSGSIHLSSFGQIMLRKGANVTFINNTGSEGACIVVRGQLVAFGFTKQLYNPQCFLQYEEPRSVQQDWQVNMLFENNSAISGPVVYASDLDICEWFKMSSPFFSENTSEVWNFMELRDNYIIRRKPQKRRLNLPDYFFQTDAHSLWYPGNKAVMEVFPGQFIQLPIMALDEYNHTTSAFLEISSIENTLSNKAKFEPSIVQTTAGIDQINFTYRSDIVNRDIAVKLSISFTVEEAPGINFTLRSRPCLPGYYLRDEECTCEETAEVVLCDEERRGVLLALGLWGAPPNWSRELVTYTCPAGYCNCTRNRSQSIIDEGNGCLLDYSNPFALCHNTRTGILCGKCNESYGVGLLTNHCRQFKDKIPQAYWLVPLYLGILVPLLVAIVKLGFHFPTILRSFLFYIQIAPIAAEFLPEEFNLKLDIMSCIGSVLSLYVPYDFSFHAEMTALESYGLRYLTPLIALIVVPIAARVRHHHSKYWHGIWSVILVLYIMITQTSVSLLFCPKLVQRLANDERQSIIVWFYDGSVTCFHGWHLLLTIIALITLVALALLVPLVAASIYFRPLRRKVRIVERLEPFSKALTRGFKEEYKWWPIIELSSRYIAVLTIITSSGYKVVPLVVSVVVLVLQMFAHPYKWKIANYIESLVLFNLVVLLTLGNATPLVSAVTSVSKFTLWPLGYLPVFFGGVIAVVLAVYHSWQFLIPYKDKVKEFFKMKIDDRSRENFLRRFDASYVSRKAWLVSEKQFTQSVVALVDPDEEEEEEVDRVKLLVNSVDSEKCDKEDSRL